MFNKYNLFTSGAILLALAACNTTDFANSLNNMNNSIAPYFAIDDTTNLFSRETFEDNKNYDMAFKYHHGFGKPRDHVIAKQYYEKAIAEGDSRAMNELGVLLISGSGLINDPKSGFEYISRSAQMGNSSARFNLGISLYNGFYSEANKSEGLKLITTAANQGHLKAQSFIVDWLMEVTPEEIGSTPQILSLIDNLAGTGRAEYYTIVSEQSEYKGLWKKFFNANIVEKDLMMSDLLALESDCVECKENVVVKVSRKLDEIQNLRELSGEGNVGAKYNLALAYMNGNGVPKNEHKAARLMVESADMGYAPAQYALGTYFLEGRGVNSSIHLAYAFFNLAASSSQGYQEKYWSINLLDWMDTYYPKDEIRRGQNFASNWTIGSEWYKK